MLVLLDDPDCFRVRCVRAWFMGAKEDDVGESCCNAWERVARTWARREPLLYS